MQRETELFIDSVFRENRSVLDLLTRELHVPQRAAGEALRHPERARAATSAASRFPDGSPRGGLLGQGSVLTITLVLDAHLAGAARQVGAREPAVGGAAAAAARRAGAEDRRTAPGKPLTMREAMTQHRANPACAELPRADGSDRLRDGELRRRRAMARRATAAQPIDATGVLPGRHDVRRASPG